MTNTTAVLSLWVLTAAGVQLGTLWIMKTSILPMLNALPYDRYVNVCHLIDMHVFHPIAVWNGIIAAGIGGAAAYEAPNNTAAALFAVGSLFMIVVGITSEGFNRPVWRQIERWSPHRVADERWVTKRRNWWLAHEVRTFGAMFALAAYFGAFLATAVS
jgi:hypothetical protein